jgi:hypothetical protein
VDDGALLEVDNEALLEVDEESLLDVDEEDLVDIEDVIVKEEDDDLLDEEESLLEVDEDLIDVEVMCVAEVVAGAVIPSNATAYTRVAAVAVTGMTVQYALELYDVTSRTSPTAMLEAHIAAENGRSGLLS